MFSPTAMTRAIATIPATRRPCSTSPRAAGARLIKADTPDAGTRAVAWGVAAHLADRSVPQDLQNLLPSGICVPQLGQNMGASRIAARDPPAPSMWVVVHNSTSRLPITGRFPIIPLVRLMGSMARYGDDSLTYDAGM